MVKNYYKILAIPRNAESAQIKQNAQALLNKTKKEYLTNLQEIKKAYSVIANPKYRKIYDNKSSTRYYQLLRIGIDTEQALIKELAQNTVNVVKQEYKNNIAEIRKAYFTLSDPKTRGSYDNIIFQQKYQKLLQQPQIKKSKFPLARLVFLIFLLGFSYLLL